MNVRSITVACLTGLALTASLVGPVHAVEPTAKFANCTALVKAYPSGVAKSAAAAGKAVANGQQRPKVSLRIYTENASKDRDKDGVVCEQSA